MGSEKNLKELSLGILKACSRVPVLLMSFNVLDGRKDLLALASAQQTSKVRRAKSDEQNQRQKYQEGGIGQGPKS